ncbi:hypothetical protein MUK42_28085 [Musa troglodytarum]|uniref:Uncharacterized protein n=1 Tax=Musa troglodytarum TaxID=320322 RepID=A0A9E7JPS6_9LILI|nr:hypothetical protein MUK42_28085 [Musa troglodytarum]
MKLEKASGKAGRDSSLAKWVFGKMESVVSFTKFKREILVVVALLCRFVLPDSTRLSKGAFIGLLKYLWMKKSMAFHRR